MGDDSNPKQNLIFTYGTLKRGLPNHPLIQTLISTNDAIFLGERTTTQALPLIIGLFGIPYLINLPGSGHQVRGELYSVTDLGLAKLDELEGVAMGHYERLKIDIVGGDRDGKIEAYFAHRSFGEEMWVKQDKAGISEYTEAEAEIYLRKEFRPKDVDFPQAIRLFLG